MFPNGNDLQSKKRKVFGECDINDDSVDSLENVESGETWEPGSQPSEPSGRPTEAASAGSTPVSPQHAPLNENKANGSNGVVIPVTKDFTQLPSSNFGTITGAGLRDEVEGQSWLLKRLVGNIFCQYVNADGNWTRRSSGAKRSSRRASS